MQQTNRIPGGFLDLIGAETGGKNPPRYADLLTPSVEMFELYAGQTLSGATQTVSTVNPGETFDLKVPQNEAWYLRSLSVDVLYSASTRNERWSFWIGSLPREAATATPAAPIIWTTRFLEVALANQRASDAFMLPQPILLLPGVNIGAGIFERSAHPANNTILRYGFNRFT